MGADGLMYDTKSGERVSYRFVPPNEEPVLDEKNQELWDMILDHVANNKMIELPI